MAETRENSGLHTPFLVTVILNIVFAFSKGIPELDGFITGARHDLSVIGTKADRKYIGGVTDKLAGGCTGVKIPQAQSVIPRRRQSELSVRRDHNIGNKVVMAVEDSFGVSVRVLVTSQCPDDDGFVYTT
jgi:hypothetical protein